MAIGFYVAILLGYGPPTVRVALGLLLNKKDFALVEKYKVKLLKLIGRKTEDEGEGDAQPQLTEQPQTEQPPEKDAAGDLNAMIESLAKADLADLMTDESADVMQVSPIQEVFDDTLATALSERGTEVWMMNDKNIETSIMQLNAVMIKNGKFSADLDERLRSIVGKPDEAFVRKCLQEMKDDYGNYVSTQSAISEKIKERMDEFGELKHIANSIEFSNMEQASQIETTLNNLDQIALRGTPEEGVSRMITELALLCSARHRLRDMQDLAFLEMAHYENRVDTISPQLFTDEATGIRNRIGIDVALDAWWKQEKQKQRSVVFALLDFVKLSDLNLEYGIKPCDKLIAVVGRMLEKTFDALDVTGMYAGGCLFVATSNLGTQKTKTEIDKFRQKIAKAVFDGSKTRTPNGNKPLLIKTTMTCAVIEVAGSSSLTDTYAALDKTLEDAKKIGQNHTFFYDANKPKTEPSPIDAPDFGMEEVTIELV
jgi:diguanylate cyclase (GGDEF)-like protein